VQATAQLGGACTSAESGDCTGVPCRRRSLRLPSSFCRRCRAGRLHHRTGTPCRGVEHQLLGLPEVAAYKRHAAVRQLHVRRLDRQRQILKRDRLVAPVELVGFSRRKAHRHISLRRNPGAFVAPSPDEPMHAVMGAVVANGDSTSRNLAKKHHRMRLVG
jgi:hypothetical protein